MQPHAIPEQQDLHIRAIFPDAHVRGWMIIGLNNDVVSPFSGDRRHFLVNITYHVRFFNRFGSP